MQVVLCAGSSVVGIEVVAEFARLATAVPAAWRELFSRHAEVPTPAGCRYAEASRHLGGGRYREVVGVVVAEPVAPPVGMSAVRIPGGDWVHHRHTGPVAEIGEGFQEIYGWATEQGITLGERKLDVGYHPDGTEGSHDLYIDVVVHLGSPRPRLPGRQQ
jgi:predicted transcriptional regulator YdeE